MGAIKYIHRKNNQYKNSEDKDNRLVYTVTIYLHIQRLINKTIQQTTVHQNYNKEFMCSDWINNAIRYIKEFLKTCILARCVDSLDFCSIFAGDS